MAYRRGFYRRVVAYLMQLAKQQRANSSTLRDGLVATHGLYPSQFYDTTRQMNNQTVHTLTQPTESIRLMFPNFYNFGTPVGDASDISVAIQYPGDSGWTRIPIGGLSTGTIPDGGTILTDEIEAPPVGVPFFVRNYYRNDVGMPCARMVNCGDANMGEARVSTGTTMADLTLGGDFGGNTLSNLYGPCAIIGKTEAPSILVLGDSIVAGWNNDGGIPDNPENGSICPSLYETNQAYTSSGNYGFRASTFVDEAFDFAHIHPYISHVICELGVSDIRQNANAADTMAAVQAIRAMFPQQEFYGVTLTPTDNNNAERLLFNAMVRGGVFDGYLEIADVVETARDSSVWKTDYSDDNRHGLLLAYQAIIASGAIAL